MNLWGLRGANNGQKRIGVHAKSGARIDRCSGGTGSAAGPLFASPVGLWTELPGRHPYDCVVSPNSNTPFYTLCIKKIMNSNK